MQAISESAKPIYAAALTNIDSSDGGDDGNGKNEFIDNTEASHSYKKEDVIYMDDEKETMIEDEIDEPQHRPRSEHSPKHNKSSKLSREHRAIFTRSQHSPHPNGKSNQCKKKQPKLADRPSYGMKAQGINEAIPRLKEQIIQKLSNIKLPSSMLKYMQHRLSEAAQDPDYEKVLLLVLVLILSLGLYRTMELLVHFLVLVALFILNQHNDEYFEELKCEYAETVNTLELKLDHISRENERYESQSKALEQHNKYLTEASNSWHAGYKETNLLLLNVKDEIINLNTKLSNLQLAYEEDVKQIKTDNKILLDQISGDLDESKEASSIMTAVKDQRSQPTVIKHQHKQHVALSSANLRIFMEAVLAMHDTIYPNQYICKSLQCDFNQIPRKRHQTIFDAVTHKEFNSTVLQGVFGCDNFSFAQWMEAVTDIKAKTKPQPKVNKGEHIIQVLKCIDAAFKKQSKPQPEKVYQKALQWELEDNKYTVSKEKRVPLYFHQQNQNKLKLSSTLRMDLFIECPPTVIELKQGLKRGLQLRHENQVKKYSKNRPCLSFLVNFPDDQDRPEVKCWEPDERIKDGFRKVYDSNCRRV